MKKALRIKHKIQIKQRLIDIWVKHSVFPVKDIKKPKITYMVEDEHGKLIAPVGATKTENEAKAKCEILMKRRKGFYAGIRYNGKLALQLIVGKDWKDMTWAWEIDPCLD